MGTPMLQRSLVKVRVLSCETQPKKKAKTTVARIWRSMPNRIFILLGLFGTYTGFRAEKEFVTEWRKLQVPGASRMLLCRLTRKVVSANIPSQTEMADIR